MSSSARGLFDTSLFGGPAPRVRATLSSASFLDVLVRAMGAELRGDPFALADALVLLPNRRATQGLIDAFADKLGGAALLPSIRPLGDLEDDPDVWGAAPMAIDPPPAIEPLRRKLELASLIRARDAAEGGASDPVRALAFADELCALLDQAASVDAVDWSKLGTLVEERAFAEHWQRSAQFLQIVATYWPQRLAADGLIDAADRRSRLILALAAEWEREPPQTPVVIAGSTGSVAATRVLMKVVASLPRGAVLLPGLDVDLDDSAWEKIDPQHPQYALKQTLATLRVARADAALLDAGSERAQARARRVLIREALAPADATADWLTRLKAAGGAMLAADGAAGLSLYEADTEEEEASLIALLLREALEKEGRTAALATPDANLARRVAAKLARWNIRPLMSLGGRLEASPPGVLMMLLCELALDDGDPVALAGLLAHPLARIADAQAIRALERGGQENEEQRAGLRGPRRHGSLQDLRAKALSRCHALIDETAQALAPLRFAGEGVTLSAFAEGIAAAAENAAGRRVWAGGDGAACARFIRELIDHGAELGALSAREAARAFRQALSREETPPERDGDPRVAILGPLEARLQRRDLVILGSLNDGIWPAPPREDPFLSRPMREALGLPSPDARLGLAAHDFAQLANAREAVLTRSLKREGAPTVASRWVWRLKTLLRGAAGAHLIEPAPARDARGWAKALDAPRTKPPPLKAPRPALPAGARLKQLSVTDVETLIRDPYAIYARRVLGLRVLDPIGAKADARKRGTAVHKAIERLEALAAPDAAMLADFIDEELLREGFSREQALADRARLAGAAETFVTWLGERRAMEARVFLEKEGRITLPRVDVELRARADRIEILPNGRAVVTDYKTGDPPSDNQVQSGLAPQLLLEAAMLARQGFRDVPQARAEALIYWKFARTAFEPRTVGLEGSAADAAEEALENLCVLLGAYLEERQPFLCKPRVQFIKPYEDYDLLARRKEWVDAEDVLEW
ncbi:MAG: double-strand break repair protein AddB [Hyphomonadaceae bacterium]|nr:double-strand break repair protein AddB [Hyphomonadaceae bacterium]